MTKNQCEAYKAYAETAARFLSKEGLKAARNAYNKARGLPPESE